MPCKRKKDNGFSDDIRTVMLLCALLDHEWHMIPALKEITVEPPVTTSSIDRQKQFVSKMFFLRTVSENRTPAKTIPCFC